MFNRTSLRVFVIFSTFIVSIAVVLSVLFARLVVEQQETSLLDSLANQISRDAKAELGPESSWIDEKQELRGPAQNEFSVTVFLKQLPPSGIAVFACQSRSGVDHLCSAAQRANGTWSVSSTAAPDLGDVLYSLFKEIMGSIFILLAVALGLAFILTRILMRPLRLLTLASRKILNGEYSDISLPEDRLDEVGDLARSFRKMIEGVENREQYLRDAGTKLAHSARLATIGQMGASIAHEVKNPLMAMHGHARLLKQKTKETDLGAIADILIAESDRCNQILQQMLRYSRSEEKERKAYSIKDVVMSSIQLVNAEAKRRHVEIELNANIDTVLIGNAQQIQQVFLNILLNALQATPAGKKVFVSAIEDEAKLTLEVKDQGGGIPAEIQSRIFEPFFTTKDKKEGSGLGLSIASTLIAEEDGQISFVTGPEGTRFQIILPLPQKERTSHEGFSH